MKLSTSHRLPFTKQTPIGTITNMGTLTGFDSNGFAHFIQNGYKNWFGPKTFNFVQVIKPLV